MFAIENYSGFLITILIYKLVPGPCMITILNTTARYGIAVGFITMLGVLAGDFLYMCVVITGLTSVMKTNPLVFPVLQGFGVVYLAFIGMQLLRTKICNGERVVIQRHSHWIYFRQAFLVSVSNPMTMAFFVALFPLFLSATAPANALIFMMLHVTALGFLYQSDLVLLGSAASQRLRSISSAQLWGARLAGLSLIVFSIKLALDNPSLY